MTRRWTTKESEKSKCPGCRYGTHRVIEPKGVLPQAAWKIDNSPVLYDNETLVDVRTLNIDAASFKQILSTCPAGLSDAEREQFVADAVLDIIRKRGKMHNPVTGPAACCSHHQGVRPNAPQDAPRPAT